jgi:hypothetical protein
VCLRTFAFDFFCDRNKYRSEFVRFLSLSGKHLHFLDKLKRIQSFFKFLQWNPGLCLQSRRPTSHIGNRDIERRLKCPNEGSVFQVFEPQSFLEARQKA